MAAPLIVHVIHRLGIGGLENGLVNLINHLPQEKYRHVIISLTEATAFKNRIHRPDVRVYEMHKQAGQDFGLYLRLYKMLRALRPAIVHTRNLATVECQLPAWLAGVPIRIHGEHGWDVFDPDGTNRKYQWLRRAFRPLVHQYIPLSQQLENYLHDTVGIPDQKITRICNGVDTEIFYPPRAGREMIPGCPFTDPEQIVIGTVGRMHGVKDQTTLVSAFIHLLERQPALKRTLRLICVGDGPLREKCLHLLGTAGLSDLAWLPGERHDIAQVMRGLNVFVLPSQAEGISNTILEAMATGLPIVATKVGGNLELIKDGISGTLVPASDIKAMGDALENYVGNSDLRSKHGNAALARIQSMFSLTLMVNRYAAVYDDLLQGKIH